jgi:hypothetical protein
MTSFIKTPEAVKEYAKYNKPYPMQMWDVNHEQFFQKTAKSDEHQNFCTISILHRVRSSYINPEHDKLFKDNQKEQREGTKMREYVVYSLIWHRCDPLGNIKHSFQPNLGVMPKLQPTYKIRRDSQGYEEKYVASLSIAGNAYYIPYTGPESVKKLLKDLEKKHGATLRDLSTEEGRRNAAQDQMKREKWAAEHGKVVYQPGENSTGFSVSQEGWQKRYRCSSFEDFCNADFDDIVNFGFKPTEQQRKDRLAAEEVARVQRLTSSATTGMADELERARNRLSGEHIK